MLTGQLGVRMLLLVGKTLPVPAAGPIISALTRVEVSSDDDKDGFQLTFTLAKRGPLEYALLASGAVDPMSRVSIGVAIGAAPYVLINGVVTHHQVMPGTHPGESTLTVTGEDLGALMDLHEVNEPYPQLSDSAIVAQVLQRHVLHGVVPPHRIEPTTTVRSERDGVAQQRTTDLAFVRALARRNGFVCYLDPITFGASRLHWGPRPRAGVPQRALTVNMGASTNVRSLTFAGDARAPVAVAARVLGADGAVVAVPPTPAPTTGAPLAAAPTPAARTVIARDVAHLSAADAAARARALAAEAPDPVTGSGELDTLRYGGVLRSRQLVGVRGAGASYDGTYYVKQVTHVLARGEYTQRFTLGREGRGATSSAVTP